MRIRRGGGGSNSLRLPQPFPDCTFDEEGLPDLFRPLGNQIATLLYKTAGTICMRGLIKVGVLIPLGLPRPLPEGSFDADYTLF